MENSPTLSDCNSSVDESDEDNTSTTSSTRTKKPSTSRRGGIGLPLWQIRSMQNELSNTPSPTLKRKLLKIESLTSLSDQQLFPHSSSLEDGEDEDEYRKEHSCSDESGIDNVDLEMNHHARVSSDSISLDSDTVIKNFESVDRFQRKVRTVTGTEYRRNRYAVSYFATNNNTFSPENTDKIKFDNQSNNTKSSPSVIKNLYVSNSRDFSDNYLSCSSLPEHLKSFSCDVKSIKKKVSSLRVQNQMALIPPYVEKSMPVENKDITANYTEDDKLGDITLESNNENSHSRDFPKILIDDPEVEKNSNQSFSSVKHDKDRTLLDSCLFADQDLGIYSQCSNSSCCNEKREYMENLTRWIHQLQSRPPSALTSRAGSQESVDFYNAENLQHMRSEIGTLRDEIQEIKSGMVTLTELMRLSATVPSTEKEGILEDSF